MRPPRTVVLGIAVGAIFAVYLAFWLHVFPVVAIAAGTASLVVILLLGAAFGDDAEALDRAWRREAGADAGRPPETPSEYEPTVWPEPAHAGDQPRHD